jgi:heat shock protein HspQ
MLQSVHNYYGRRKLSHMENNRSLEKPVAKFGIGQVVRHRVFPFRGVIYDVDPTFANTEAWWEAIPEAIRPRKDQPFYHLLAENDENHYTAYVSEQNLLADTSGEPVEHPSVSEMFADFNGEAYARKDVTRFN